MKTNHAVNDSEKGRAYREKYMREYMKDERADDNFKTHENEKWVQSSNINSKHLGTRSTRLLKKENWTQKMSDKLRDTPSDNETQRIRST